jgi:transcriptional regulator with XRE-family HTH domain
MEHGGDTMKDYDRISLLGENLLLFRQSLGWSAAELGERVGVTRQTINNIENPNNTTKLNKTLYLAIRCVFAEEISSNPDGTKILQELLAALIDNPDDYNEAQRKDIIEQAKMITPLIMTKTMPSDKIYNHWSKMIKLIGITSMAVGTAMTLDWVKAITAVGSHKRYKRK